MQAHVYCCVETSQKQTGISPTCVGTSHSIIWNITFRWAGISSCNTCTSTPGKLFYWKIKIHTDGLVHGEITLTQLQIHVRYFPFEFWSRISGWCHKAKKKINSPDVAIGFGKWTSFICARSTIKMLLCYRARWKLIYFCVHASFYRYLLAVYHCCHKALNATTTLNHCTNP